jgi:lysophospholipase L1-like esterase
MKLARVLLLLLPASLFAADSFALKDGDTVVFYGDSITDQRLYTAFTEAYVVTRFPNLHVRFVHSGWGGDRVDGGGGGPIDKRLQRDVIAYKPTVVTIMLGMNDGRYRPFDADTFNAFTTGYTHIVKTLKAALPGVRITVIQPSPYDDVTRAPQFEGGYNGVLLRFAAWLRDLAAREELTVADLNTGVVDALQRARDKDAPQAAKIIPDRIHPGASGHLLMAEGLLEAWGAPALVASVEIDAAAKSLTRSAGTTVSALEGSASGVSWTQTDAALPLPIDWKDPLIKLAVDSSDVLQRLDQEPLTVTGLAAGNYSLTIDGMAAGSFTAAQLAAGINLAQLPGPMLKQAMDVWQLTNLHNNIHTARWRTVQVPLQKYTLNKADAAQSALDALEEEITGLQHAAALPKPHKFAVTQQ